MRSYFSLKDKNGFVILYKWHKIYQQDLGDLQVSILRDDYRFWFIFNGKRFIS